jgi:hypothetical protein
MNRAFNRPVAGVALAILLLFSAVPSVGAGSLFALSGTPKEQADWKTAAWAWLNEIWGFIPGTRVTLASPQATDNTGMTRSFGATGSCFDPNGIMIPCLDGLLRPPGHGILHGPTGAPAT